MIRISSLALQRMSWFTWLLPSCTSKKHAVIDRAMERVRADNKIYQINIIITRSVSTISCHSATKYKTFKPWLWYAHTCETSQSLELVGFWLSTHSHAHLSSICTDLRRPSLLRRRWRLLKLKWGSGSSGLYLRFMLPWVANSDGQCHCAWKTLISRSPIRLEMVN